MLLDQKIENKLIDKKIIYTIVYETCDYQKATDIKKYINNKYRGDFDNYPYVIHTVEFSTLTDATPASAFYVLKASTSEIEKVAKVAKEKGVVTFSYDVNNLKYGLLFSLMLERTTVLYLNKDYLHLKTIDFVDSLLQMVQFINQKAN
jgi:hypothetical protein